MRSLQDCFRRHNVEYRGEPTTALALVSQYIVQLPDGSTRLVAATDKHLVVLGDGARDAQQKAADGSLSAKVCGYGRA